VSCSLVPRYVLALAGSVGTQIGQFVQREQSTQDPTTRLPSRSALLEHLEEAIRDADRNDRPLALIMPRLDELQEINDSLGPDNGDVILRQVAARAHYAVRQDDVVARLDVNEFGVLLPGPDLRSARKTICKLLMELKRPYTIEGQTFDVGVIGGSSRE